MIDFTKYFEKVYCINLDSRLDRWESVNKEFNKWGIINVERYPGIDGNEKYKDYIGLLPGEIGILMTHLDIIKKAKEDGLNNVMIMEDDVYFSDEIINYDKYLSQIPENWDMFYLGGMQLGGKPPIPITKNIFKINHTLMIHCIAINNTIYDYILNLLPKLEKQVDVYYMMIQKKFNCYSTNPHIAFQNIGFSSIQSKIVDYHIFYNK